MKELMILKDLRILAEREETYLTEYQAIVTEHYKECPSHCIFQKAEKGLLNIVPIEKRSAIRIADLICTELNIPFVHLRIKDPKQSFFHQDYHHARGYYKGYCREITLHPEDYRPYRPALAVLLHELTHHYFHYSMPIWDTYKYAKDNAQHLDMWQEKAKVVLDAWYIVYEQIDAGESENILEPRKRINDPMYRPVTQNPGRWTHISEYLACHITRVRRDIHTYLCSQYASEDRRCRPSQFTSTQIAPLLSKMVTHKARGLMRRITSSIRGASRTS